MRVGLIGDPLGHSFSPRLHAAFGTADYELHPIPAEALPAFFRERAFEGVNVTIPHKIAVIPLLDELHPSAEECGAVNTVVNRGGKLTGYNTDIFGMSFALAHAGISLSGRHVVILGSGGTSHTARALAKREGAASVTVVSRSGEVNYSNIAELVETEIVINTTPVGMFPHADASPVDLTVFPRLRGVFDAVFNPLRTRLIEQAESLGVPVASGLLMLTAQAKAAGILFRGGDYSEPSPASEVGAEILKVWREVTAELTNIVLIGMPSSGKTTVGTLLAVPSSTRTPRRNAARARPSPNSSPRAARSSSARRSASPSPSARGGRASSSRRAEARPCSPKTAPRSRATDLSSSSSATRKSSTPQGVPSPATSTP